MNFSLFFLCLPFCQKRRLLHLTTTALHFAAAAEGAGQVRPLGARCYDEVWARARQSTLSDRRGQLTVRVPLVPGKVSQVCINLHPSIHEV